MLYQCVCSLCSRDKDLFLHSVLGYFATEVIIVSVVFVVFVVSVSAAAVVGERLAASENERKRLVRAIELMRCLKAFEETPITKYAQATNLNNDELLEILPELLQEKTWGDIVQVQ